MIRSKFFSIAALLLISHSFLNAQSFEWGGRFGGIGEDVVRDICTDASGNVYTTGYFTDVADLDASSSEHLLTSTGFFDIFIQKTNPDGTFNWAQGFGSAGFEYGTGVFADAEGYVYVTGVFEGSFDADPGSEAYTLTSHGAQDIFVLKLSQDGSFVWAADLGSADYDESTAIASDAEGNVYISGYFNGVADFDPGSGVANFTAEGANDNFLVKLDEAGDFVWAKQYGSAGFEAALDMTVAENKILVTGFFEGTVDFDPNAGEELLSSVSGNSTSAFVLILDTAGVFQNAAIIGGNGNVTAYDIESDGDAIYVTGTFAGTADFNPGTEEVPMTSEGFENGFVLKLNSQAAFLWVRTFNSAESVISYSVTTDDTGNVYASGYFENTADFNPGTQVFSLSPAPENAMGAYLVKLKANGDFVNAWSFGGVNFSDYHGVAADQQGNVFISGAYETTVDINPFPTDSNIFISEGFRDNYLVKLNGSMAGIKSSVENLFVFPNPAESTICIQQKQPDLAFSMFDVTGKIVVDGNLRTGENQISISHINPGIYLLRIGAVTTKIIISR